MTPAHINITDDQIARFKGALAGVEPKKLTFRSVVERTGVSLRDLRYVIDHELADLAVFSATDQLRSGPGRARTLSVYSAFTLALPALMLQAGIRGPIVRKVMDRLVAWTGGQLDAPATNAVSTFLIFAYAVSAVVELGDGEAMRILVEDGQQTPGGLASPRPLPWTGIDTGEAVAPGYSPVVAIRLNLAELRAKLN